MMDIILTADHTILTRLNVEGTNYFRQSTIQPGGCGNVAASISHLGGRAAVIGRAGDDAYGREYVRDLESRKIIPRVNLDHSGNTGVTVSIVEPGGHRTMLVSRGANDKLTEEETRKQFKELGPSKFTYVSGYSLVRSPQRDTVLKTAERIHRQKSSVTVFDAASSNLVRAHRAIFGKLTESANILCANLDEARALSKKGRVTDFVHRASKNGRVVIVKMGPDGCLVGKDGKLSKIPGYSVDTVDTTGAGDAFLGSLLYCLSRNIELERAASFGNWFASHLTTGLGARHFPMPRKARKMLALVK